jgi:sialidase-1
MGWIYILKLLFCSSSRSEQNYNINMGRYFLKFKVIRPYVTVWLITLSFFFINLSAFSQEKKEELSPGLRKVKDVVIYMDTMFHSAFPSVIKMKDGKLVVAFRRAPERRMIGEKHTHHVDPNSYLVSVKSTDGENWTPEPGLIYAHPFGGSQDPGLLQLKDGTILCTSYTWSFINQDGVAKLKAPNFQSKPGVVLLGGYLLRSTDRGKTWQKPLYPPHVPQEVNFDLYGKPLPAYNRGALYEGKNGRVYWVVAATDQAAGSGGKKTSTYLLVSDDKGLSWKFSATVARDERISFNETSIYETPKGDLVAFLRSAGLDDEACIARSIDGGKTFQKWESMGFKGHPLHALKLPDNRVLITYGYRHKPYGIRARILNAECTDFKTAPEIVLRTDGGGWDLGYPWAVQLNKNTVLVVYYYNIKDSTRHIAGTILEIDKK